VFRKPFAVATAVFSLLCGLLLCIQRQAHHKGCDAPLAHHMAQVLEIGRVSTAPQSCQRGHGEPQGITASETNALAAHIEGKH
jgi:hypothetical protein